MGLHEEPPKADDTTEKVDEEVPDEVEEQDEEDIDFDEDGNFSKSCDLCLFVSKLLFIPAYRALDAQLDQLNSVLDALEERNDKIHEKAKDLLKSNRESRMGSSEPESPDQQQPMDS